MCGWLGGWVCAYTRVCCVPKSCSILSDHVDHRLPGPSVHGILQARILEWVFLQGHLPDPEIKPASPALASPTKPPGKLLKSNTIIIAGHEWCINAANKKAYSKRERVDVQLLG